MTILSNISKGCEGSIDYEINTTILIVVFIELPKPPVEISWSIKCEELL